LSRKAKDYRSKVAIYGDILQVIDENGGRASPTQILTGANLSHGRLMMHLETLMEAALVREERDEERRTYLMTEQGLNLLQEISKVKKFLEGFGLPL